MFLAVGAASCIHARVVMMLQVDMWITFNEPFVTSWMGYGLGVMAPARHGPGTYTYTAAHNIIRAHTKAYRLYVSKYKATQRGGCPT